MEKCLAPDSYHRGDSIRGLCRYHYNQWLFKGDRRYEPLPPKPFVKDPKTARFIRITDDMSNT